MSYTVPDDPTTRRFMRHLLATLAYRTGKAVRQTPDAFASYKGGT